MAPLLCRAKWEWLASVTAFIAIRLKDLMLLVDLEGFLWHWKIFKTKSCFLFIYLDHSWPSNHAEPGPSLQTNKRKMRPRNCAVASFFSWDNFRRKSSGFLWVVAEKYAQCKIKELHMACSPTSFLDGYTASNVGTPLGGVTDFLPRSLLPLVGHLPWARAKFLLEIEK